MRHVGWQPVSNAWRDHGMFKAARRFASALLVAWLPACASSQPAALKSIRAGAERHYTHGRYSQAATAWEQAAAGSAGSERAEATYRAGAAHQRAGHLVAASRSYRLVLTQFPESARAPRAAYDLALIQLAQGERQRGYAQLRQVIVQYQTSAMAGRAFERLLRIIRKNEGTAAALGFLDSVLTQVHEPKLTEKLRYFRAQLLHERGDSQRALAEYLRIADDFAYPRGAYWDDCLWHAADLYRRRAAPQRAIALLKRMLKQSEPAHFQGSYARARYAQAEFRIAEIYRDDLRRPADAQRHFRKVFTNHPTSLLRDDALWQEALLARAHGQKRNACAALAELVDTLPESRFAPCAPLICPALSGASSGASCRNYIRRSIRTAPSYTAPNNTAPNNTAPSSAN